MSCSPLEATRGLLAPARAAGELALSTPIACARLHAVISVRCCLLRQAVSERQRMNQGGRRSRWAHRGQAGDFPGCTASCAQGRRVRETLDPDARIVWLGAGPGRRFQRPRTAEERAAQDSARRRLKAVGLLDVPPCMDEPPVVRETDDG